MNPVGAAVAFLKGHGTENDFVVLPDSRAELELNPQRVRALCDRSRGLGADGVLRVVPARDVPDAPAGIDGEAWFMDYRNADGSVAEMCGNGVRLFARYLYEEGLVPGREFTIGTRGGPTAVRVHADGMVGVAMGAVTIGPASAATVAGQTLWGRRVDLANPHLVCTLDAADGGTGEVSRSQLLRRLEGLQLCQAPEVDDGMFPDGVNVEFVVPAADPGRGTDKDPVRIRMRVHERGVGETRSCGTGTVAAAAEALRAAGQATGTVTVDVPGGSVGVRIEESASVLTGPAELVARGELDPHWWQRVGEHGQ